MGGERTDLTEEVGPAVERYGVPRRTIQHWIATAKKKGAPPPPLRDPEAMVAWWPLVFSGAPRRELMIAAGGPGENMEEPPSAADAADDGGDPDERNLRNLGEAIAESRKAWKEATNPALKKLELETWLKLTEQKRKLDKEYVDLQEQKGNVVRKATVVEALQLSFGPLADLLRNGYRRLCTELACEPDPEMERAWKRMADDAMRGLAEERFGLG